MYEPELYTVQYLKPWVAERHTRVQDLLEPSMHGMSDGQGYFFFVGVCEGPSRGTRADRQIAQ